ncbi:TRAP-type C4-dicarboxylate transporter, large permease component [Candidatus Moduliflexus flocculans]|uniref:TRAP-type C4-dicarboxylate transporter, large permease component n=1 Tax=Candidatus Moduliflexus flocculans TaxID=1499966 RepID=A0A081BQW6_9BACT|nr:TRAP-type C4-dicarboxylate transporter, large permease component [Candidatus Moduliflexus flocculans]
MNGGEVLLLFLIFVCAGVPLAVAMGAPAILYILVEHIPLSTVAHRMQNSINSYPLLAVPAFIFAANLMNTSGITMRLFNFARSLLGRLPGALAQVNVVASLIFSGISGAALADVGGLGAIEIKAMKENGYTAETAAAITAASATIGPIFPPSIPFIIYATVAEVSGVRQLLAGVVPALLIALFFMLEIVVLAKRQHFPRDTQKTTWQAKWRIFISAFPALMTPVLLMAGLLSGMFSPTEVASVTVIYALLLGVFVYRELTWTAFVQIAKESIRSTANIMFVVSAAAIFAFVLTIEQMPSQIAELMLGISKDPVVLLMLTNVVLLLLGMIMETIAALMVMTPILVPVLTQVGVDPVHVGVVMVLNLMIGLLTPPVGMSLYLVSIVSELPVERVIKAILPYFIPLLLALIMVTLFPSLSTWLPNLVFGQR